jgi:hypothetical protein
MSFNSVTASNNPSLELYYVNKTNVAGNKERSLLIEALSDPSNKIKQNQKLIDAIKSVATQYITELGNQFNFTIKAHLTINSAVIAINSSDSNLVKFVQEKSSFLLESVGQSNTEMTVFLKQAGGLTTGGMRFSHLLLDLFNRFRNNCLSQSINVCIVGPGCFKTDGYMPTSPQLVETLTVLPNANYLVLEQNNVVSNILKQQLRVFKGLAYDPTSLKRCAVKKDESSAPLYQMMKEVVIEKALDQKSTLETFNTGLLDQVVVKVDPAKFTFQEFDLNHSQLPVKGLQDVIIATMVIENSRPSDYKTNPQYDHFKIMVKLLDGLKDDGILYMDANAFKTFDEIYGAAAKEKYVLYLIALLGRAIQINILNLIDKDCSDKNLKHIPSPNIGNADQLVSSEQIVSIMKTARVECPASELTKMKQELDAIQIAFQKTT